MPISGVDGPYLDDPESEYLLYILGSSPDLDIDLSTKADLDGDGFVVASQLPGSPLAVAGTHVLRTSTNKIKSTNAIEPDDVVTYQQHIDDAAVLIGVLPNVQEKRLTANIVGTAADTFANGVAVGIPGLDVTGVKTGDHWKLHYLINAEASQTEGYAIRFISTATTPNTISAADYQVEGFWQSMSTVAAPVNNNYSRQEVILYPAAHPSGVGGNSLVGSFGGLGAGVAGHSWIMGYFDVYVTGVGRTNDTLGIEFAQRVTGAIPARTLAGSKLLAVEV